MCVSHQGTSLCSQSRRDYFSGTWPSSMDECLSVKRSVFPQAGGNTGQNQKTKQKLPLKGTQWVRSLWRWIALNAFVRMLFIIILLQKMHHIRPTLWTRFWVCSAAALTPRTVLCSRSPELSILWDGNSVPVDLCIAALSTSPIPQQPPFYSFYLENVLFFDIPNFRTDLHMNNIY